MISLRQQLRQNRKALSSAYRKEALEKIIQRVLALPEFKQARTIAGYTAFDGEVDALPLLELALEQGKRCFIPRILKKENDMSMEFMAFEHLEDLVANAFGILEPSGGESYSPEKLELVLTPLVGFNQHAHRLGMGKGYYDRCFHFMRDFSKIKKPFLLGLAFDCQYSELIPFQEHDVPLNAVITESALFLGKS